MVVTCFKGCHGWIVRSGHQTDVTERMECFTGRWPPVLDAHSEVDGVRLAIRLHVDPVRETVTGPAPIIVDRARGRVEFEACWEWWVDREPLDFIAEGMVSTACAVPEPHLFRRDGATCGMIHDRPTIRGVSQSEHAVAIVPPAPEPTMIEEGAILVRADDQFRRCTEGRTAGIQPNSGDRSNPTRRPSFTDGQVPSMPPAGQDPRRKQCAGVMTPDTEIDHGLWKGVDMGWDVEFVRTRACSAELLVVVRTPAPQFTALEPSA